MSTPQTGDDRPHDWKTQYDTDGNPYQHCIRTDCGLIWSRHHTPNQPEPTGCKGKEVPPGRRTTPHRRKEKK